MNRFAGDPGIAEENETLDPSAQLVHNINEVRRLSQVMMKALKDDQPKIALTTSLDCYEIVEIRKGLEDGELVLFPDALERTNLTDCEVNWAYYQSVPYI